ncbi:hypothetical protein M6D81_11575 [Paenibacillus sp. J5C_2022]|uniref:hypothetical protein n=1 Tax=Paenibacillus sp. J5C2022 TaxID=2977129 RepID=UPI0021CFF306|nr:hypothetical protein [Paenibacillus sp. J5C2022]MCU6709347.1 hypothetical protein [Paenibacillus sp. J5C2022]
MTVYLQLDGVDDALTIPQITFSRILLDATIEEVPSWGKVIGKPFGFVVQRNSASENFQWNPDHVISVRRDGSEQADLTPFISLDSRHLYDIETLSGTSLATYILSNNGSSGFGGGKIYDIKYYNGGALVAHYDMSTGTVADQSGNGHDATLTGGTWLDDGEGGGTEYTAALSDGFTVVDSLSKRLTIAVADAINTGDGVSGGTDRYLADNISGIDSVSVTSGKSVMLSDAFALSEALRKAVSAGLADGIGTADSFGGQGDYDRSATDSISIIDAIQTSSGKLVTLFDVVSAADDVGRAVYKAIADGMAVVDNVTPAAARDVRLYDVILAEDNVAIRPPDVKDIVATVKLEGSRTLTAYIVGSRTITVRLRGDVT